MIKRHILYTEHYLWFMNLTPKMWTFPSELMLSTWFQHWRHCSRGKACKQRWGDVLCETRLFCLWLWFITHVRVSEETSDWRLLCNSTWRWLVMWNSSVYWSSCVWRVDEMWNVARFKPWSRAQRSFHSLSYSYHVWWTGWEGLVFSWQSLCQCFY